MMQVPVGWWYITIGGVIGGLCGTALPFAIPLYGMKKIKNVINGEELA